MQHGNGINCKRNTKKAALQSHGLLAGKEKINYTHTPTAFMEIPMGSFITQALCRMIGWQEWVMNFADKVTKEQMGTFLLCIAICSNIFLT